MGCRGGHAFCQVEYVSPIWPIYLCTVGSYKNIISHTHWQWPSWKPNAPPAWTCVPLWRGQRVFRNWPIYGSQVIIQIDRNCTNMHRQHFRQQLKCGKHQGQHSIKWVWGIRIGGHHSLIDWAVTIYQMHTESFFLLSLCWLKCIRHTGNHSMVHNGVLVPKHLAIVWNAQCSPHEEYIFGRQVLWIASLSMFTKFNVRLFWSTFRHNSVPVRFICALHSIWEFAIQPICLE